MTRSFGSAPTPQRLGEFLAEAEVEVGPADEIWLDGQLVDLSAPLTSALRSGQQRQGAVLHLSEDRDTDDPPTIRIQRATSLTLDDDGTTKTLHTTLTTVGQVLQEYGVTLYMGDR